VQVIVARPQKKPSESEAAAAGDQQQAAAGGIAAPLMGAAGAGAQAGGVGVGGAAEPLNFRRFCAMYCKAAWPRVVPQPELKQEWDRLTNQELQELANRAAAEDDDD